MARNGTKTGGGSRKGKPNQRTLDDRAALLAYITHQAQTDPLAHPAAYLVAVVTSPTASTSDRVHAATALLDRLMPRLKSVEVSGDPDRPLVVMTPEQRQARIATLLAHRNGHTEGTP
jgi:hypothetical protein